MKNAFYTIWKIVKPVNKIHAWVCLLFIVLMGADLLTIPPSRVKSDYERVTGELVKYRVWRGSSSILINMTDGRQLAFGVNEPYSYKATKPWIGKKVVVYYWPGSLMSLKKRLVFMAPIDKEQVILKESSQSGDVFFKPDIYVSSAIAVICYFLFVWLVPKLITLLKCKE